MAGTIHPMVHGRFENLSGDNYDLALVYEYILQLESTIIGLCGDDVLLGNCMLGAMQYAGSEEDDDEDDFDDVDDDTTED